MVVPGWLIVYVVAILLGLIIGVLARYLLVLVAVVVAVGLFGVALLAALDPGALGFLQSILVALWNGVPFTSATFFTLGGVVFLVGVLAGVLITTPLRSFRGARPAQ